MTLALSQRRRAHHTTNALHHRGRAHGHTLPLRVSAQIMLTHIASRSNLNRKFDFRFERTRVARASLRIEPRAVRVTNGVRFDSASVRCSAALQSRPMMLQRFKITAMVPEAILTLDAVQPSSGVTPEMIEAGVSRFRFLDEAGVGSAYLVVEVFRAMCLASSARGSSVLGPSPHGADATETSKSA